MDHLITKDDDETPSEAALRERFEQLTPEQQQILYLHHLDQFEAVPSYVEQRIAQEGF